MTQRRTTRLMAAGLAVGLLALSSHTPTAHAQTLRCGGPAPVNADWRYAAHIPGAIVCARAPVAGSGEWFYTYDVTFARDPRLSFSYTITDGADRTAQGLSISRARYDLWRRVGAGDLLVSRYHRNHWLVITRHDDACVFHAGGIQGQRVFEASGGFFDFAPHGACRSAQLFEAPLIRGIRAALT